VHIQHIRYECTLAKTVLQIFVVTVQKENFETCFSDISDAYNFNIAVTTFTFCIFSKH